MPSHLGPLAVIWGSVALLALLTHLAWQQRPKRGSVLFAIAMLCGTWWAVAAAIGLSASADATMVFWARVEWAGIAFGPVAWFLFTLEYTGREKYATPTFAALISVLPTTTVILAMTNSLHGLVYVSTTRTSAGPLSMLNVQFGPWFWVHYVYICLLLGVGAVLITQLAIENRDRYLDQVIAILAVLAPPVVGSTAYLVGLEPFGALDPTPFTFVLSGLVGIVALRRYNFLDAVPISDRIARESLVDEMDQAVVVDSNGHIVKVNPAGERFFPSDDSPVGKHTSTIVPEYERLADDAHDERTTVVIQLDSRERIFEVQVTDLHTDRTGGAGAVLVFNDVTEQRTRLQRLDVLNRVLRHNLRNEMNVVYGHADRIQDPNDPEDVVAIAGKIKEKSLAMTAVGDRAREIDDILQNDDETESSATLSALIRWEVDRIGTDHPNVTVDYTTADDEAEYPTGLETILRILVDEMIDYNEQEHTAISIDVTADDGHAIVSISDNGVGIPDSERQVIESGEETELRHGSGLGLWLANWGVQAIGGTLSLMPDEELGIAVEVDVPRVRVTDEGSTTE